MHKFISSCSESKYAGFYIEPSQFIPYQFSQISGWKKRKRKSRVQGYSLLGLYRLTGFGETPTGQVVPDYCAFSDDKNELKLACAMRGIELLSHRKAQDLLLLQNSSQRTYL